MLLNRLKLFPYSFLKRNWSTKLRIYRAQRLSIRNQYRQINISTNSEISSGQDTMKTFQNQNLLPKLPIPDLEKTVERYLRSVQPLQTPDEHEKTKKLVNDFISQNGGLGPKLQERLIKHAEKQPYSWLETWWLALAYHSWRESVLVHSNWYMLLDNHPDHPAQLLNDAEIYKRQSMGFSSFQLHRTGNLVNLLLQYLDDLKNEKIPPEMTKQGPLCMNQYKYLFGITRVPLEKCDKIVGSFPPHSQHILIVVKDQIYALEISEGGKMLNSQEVTFQLERIIKEVRSLEMKSQLQPSICVLTGEHRDIWAKNYAYLNQIGNKHNFQIIEKALFTVCLDDIALTSDLDAFAQRTFTGIQGRNRWFDTCLSMIVQNDGRVSVNGEHSPLDALIPAYLFNTIISREKLQFDKDMPVRSLLSKPRRLEWKIDSNVQEAISEAIKNVNVTVNDSDLKILEFREFGSDFIKRLKVSPDAFVQMALQLTFYRIHGELTAVYETASTRKFLHGRTETTRSLSNESKAFVLAFNNSNNSIDEKYRKFKEACKAHVDYVIAASNGEGCDRHLLGLMLCMKEGEFAEIFKDPVYSASKNFRLSTSNLFPGKHLIGTGFGCVVPNGYGLNYMIHPDHIRVGIESKKSCKETSSSLFAQTLATTWRDMKNEFERFTSMNQKL